MSLRAQFKGALDQIKATTSEFWIPIRLHERVSTDHRSYDPSNPKSERDSYTTVNAFESNYSATEIDGERIQSRDRAFIIDADDIRDISMIDKIDVGGVMHEVIDYRLVQQDIYWKVQIRKGG